MVIYHGDLESTHFLNVDLDLRSMANLEPLVEAFGDKVCVLYAERRGRTYTASLEVAKLTKDADSTIRAFCALIASLPKPARKIWDGAKTRDFNIGIQAELKPHVHEIALAAGTVKAVAELNARIVITVYAPEKRKRRKSAERA